MNIQVNKIYTKKEIIKIWKKAEDYNDRPTCPYCNNNLKKTGIKNIFLCTNDYCLVNRVTLNV